MCGFAGAFAIDGVSVSEESLLEAQRLLEHRGPDAAGVYRDRNCVMVHRRLAIIDKSESANQPMLDNYTGSVLSFNGEIYNFHQLKAELQDQGVNFLTHSDTEVLLRGILHEGTGFLTKIDGDFAFVFWNPQEQKIILGRDPFGVKPLYICRQGESLYFSSEIKPLKALGVETDINYESISDYFRYRYVPKTRTLFSKIDHLAPGKVLTIHQGQESVNTFYSLSNEGEVLKIDFAETFAQAVKSRFTSDVPVGVLLSSGVDSAAIAAQASLLGLKPQTFTFSFSQSDKKLDESLHAKKLATGLKLENFKIESPVPELRDYVEVISSLEEPIGDAIILANKTLFQSIKKNVGVVLMGEGADEIFSSYVHHRVARWVGWVNKLRPLAWIVKKLLYLIPLGLLNKISFYPAQFDASIKRRLQKALSSQDSSEIFLHLSALFDEDELKRLLGKYYLPPVSFFQTNFVQTDMTNWLPRYGLLRLDKLSMAQSLEIRVPYLNSKLVDLVTKSRDWRPHIFKRDKLQFREFCKKNLQLPSFIYNKKKQPFFTPHDQKNRDDSIFFYKQVLTEERLKKYGILNYDFVSELLKVGEKPNFLIQKKLTSVVIFQLWCECFFPRS